MNHMILDNDNDNLDDDIWMICELWIMIGIVIIWMMIYGWYVNYDRDNANLDDESYWIRIIVGPCLDNMICGEYIDTWSLWNLHDRSIIHKCYSHVDVLSTNLLSISKYQRRNSPFSSMSQSLHRLEHQPIPLVTGSERIKSDASTTQFIATSNKLSTSCFLHGGFNWGLGLFMILYGPIYCPIYCPINCPINCPITQSGWWFEPLWKILVNWDDYSQYMGK